MKINFLTIFPKYYDAFKSESIIAKAIEQDKIKINVVDFREFAKNKHNNVDDTIYGGGKGMLLKVEPIDLALESLKDEKGYVILMSPQGNRFTQKKAIELSSKKNITIISGRYEGFDERVRSFIDEEISIGDYVLTGGELPSMVVADACIRSIPNIIKEESFKNDSFQNDMLDYPQYTKPAEYKGMKVPEVLLSGHHKNIEDWRIEQAKINTKNKRPDLLKNRED